MFVVVCCLVGAVGVAAADCFVMLRVVGLGCLIVL